MLLPNKDIVPHFYERAKESTNMRLSFCGVKGSQKGTWFLKFMQHLEQRQKKELMSIRKKSAGQTLTILSSLSYSQKGRNGFGWVSFVVKCLQPFSTVQKANIRDHRGYQPMLLNTFRQYLLRLSKRTENKVAALLPNCVALIFNRQTTIDAHYVNAFATFPFANCNGF